MNEGVDPSAVVNEIKQFVVLTPNQKDKAL